MGHILGGLVLIVVGSLMIYYYNQLYKMFGDIQRAEKYLGESRVVYVLFGCIVIVIGVLMLFGVGPGNPTDTTSLQYNTQ